MIYKLLSLHSEDFYIGRLLKSFLLLLLISHFPFPVLSQNPLQRARIDSLKRALSNSADIEKIKILNHLGYEYSHFNSDSSFFWTNNWNPDSAVLYSKEAYKISKEINYPHGMADALSIYSLIARDTDFLAAENYARQAVIIYKKINDERSGYRRSLFLGWYLCVLNRSDEAKVFYDSAIIYFLRVRDNKYLALAYELRADEGERGPLNQFYYMQKGDSIKNLLTGELDLNFTPPRGHRWFLS